MAEAAPERITDLLKDDDFIYDEDDAAADMDADNPETPRVSGQAAQQQQQQPAAKQRVPIPVPSRHGADASAAGEAPAAGGQLVNGALPTGGGAPMAGGAAGLPPPEACRYFIIKSNSEYNIKLSVQTGVWSTKVRRPGRSLPCMPQPPQHPGCPSATFWAGLSLTSNAAHGRAGLGCIADCAMAARCTASTWGLPSPALAVVHLPGRPSLWLGA